MSTTQYTASIQKLYVAYFGRPADPLGLAFWEARVAAQNGSTAEISVDFAKTAEFTTTYAGKSPVEIVNAIYVNLFGRNADTEGLLFWAGHYQAGNLTLATIIDTIASAAVGSDITILANKTTAATSFTEALDTAPEILAYNTTSVNIAKSFVAGVTDDASLATAIAPAALDATVASVVVSGTPVVPPLTFAATTSADVFVGGTGNDTFNAGLSSGTATLDALDSLNGGAGTDTLNVTLGNTTVQAASLTNIENIVVNGAGGTLSLLGSTGVTSLTAQGTHTNPTSFTSIASTATALKVANSAANTTFQFAASAVSGTADSATLTLQNVTTGGTQTIAGIETLNIVSSGNANETTLATAAATKYVVTGDQNLTLGAVGATVVTVDASALTGSLSLSTGGAASTITGGAGNDSITLTAGVDDSIVGGAGNDTVVTAGHLTTADTLTGGVGTDVLSGSSANLTSGTFTKITGFETLTVTDALGANLTTASVNAGVETVTLALGSGAHTVAFEAGSKTLNIGAANTGTLTVTSAGTAITDAINVKNTGAAASMFGAGGDLTATGVETLTLTGTGTGAATTQAAGAISVTASTDGTATLKFAGTNTFTTAGTVTAGVIDATGLTGSAVLTMAAAAASVTKITGSANDDTLRGDASASIDGGAGNDTIVGGSGADTLVGGAGDDSITSGGGNDSITGGAGNDTFVLADGYTTGDVIDGGDGTADALSISSATLDAVNALSFSAVGALNTAISNVERITISDSMVISGNSLDMARLDSISHVTFADQAAVAANALIGVAANSTFAFTTNTASTNDLTLTMADASGSADVINLSLTNNTDTTNFGDVTVASIETVNIATAEATSAANTDLFVFDLTATGVTTVNVTGTEGLNLSGVAVNATTINASGNAGSVNILGGSANQTITGTAAVDTISAGAGADTIDGGAGADSLVGGSGADAITGGTGADTITGGSGNDTITLTETTAAVDDVILNYSEGGTSVDTIVGFTTGASGDEFQLSLAALNAVSTSGGMFTLATTMANGAGTAVAAGAAVVNAITAAATLGATDSVIVLRGATFSSTSEVEDAIEAGGSFALTGQAGTFDDVNNSYIVVYSDGTNTHVAAIQALARTTDNSVFETGDTKVIDLAVVNGVSTIGASTFVAANFEFIA